MGIRNAEVDVFLLISKPLKKFLHKYSPQIIRGQKFAPIESIEQRISQLNNFYRNRNLFNGFEISMKFILFIAHLEFCVRNLVRFVNGSKKQKTSC
jgi:hypothetical protein